MKNISMVELTNGMCRWPISDRKDGELCFCGAPSDPAIPYCEKHMKMAHAPVRPRKTT